MGSSSFQGSFVGFQDNNLFVVGNPVFSDQYAGGSVSGSTIRVKAGSHLSIGPGSSIQGICNNMWGGIELDAPFIGSSRSRLSLTDVDIFDAYRAVYFNGITGVENVRPLISILNSNFRNCYFGLDLTRPAAGSRIVGNNFVSNYLEMHAPFDYLRNKQFYRTGKSTTDGLFVSHTGIKFSEPFNLPAADFVNNSFENMAFGILCDFGSSSSPGFPSEIGQQALFKNCHLAGIYIKGCAKVTISKNEFELPDNDNLKFKTSFQMDKLGQQYLGYSPLPTLWLPGINLLAFQNYSHGIYVSDNCSATDRELSILENQFRSLATNEAKLHSGIWLSSSTGSNVTLKRNSLSQLDFAFNSVSSGLGSLQVSGNTFTDNRTAISLQRQGSSGTSTLDFTLKCNQFKLSCADGLNATATACDNEPLRKGLVIGEGVRVTCSDPLDSYPDNIGGVDGWNSGNQYPNANDWPVAFGTDRAIFPGFVDIQEGWSSPTNWQSLENDLNNPIVTYRRYRNEFVWALGQEIGKIKTFPTSSNVKTAGTPGQPTGYENTCENLINDPDPIFPARIAVIADSQSVTSVYPSLFKNGAWLGDAVPNPAQTRTKVLGFVPTSEEVAILQFVEMSTGKVISAKAIAERGNLEIEIDLTRFPAGVYGYQIVLKDKVLGARRFVVVK